MLGPSSTAPFTKRLIGNAISACIAYRDVVANRADGADGADSPGFSTAELSLIVRVPARPFRLKVISMPSIRRNVCARRSRPASAPGIFWPARAFFPDIVTGKIVGSMEKVRGHSHPTAAFRHEFADANCYRVRLDDAFDCGFAVRIINVRKSACGPQHCSASHCPQGEVGHSRQARETNTRQGLQATHGRVKQGAQDAGSRNLELVPKLVLGAPLMLTNWRQHQENAAVGQIRSGDNVLDAIYEQGSRCLK
jgi:hypothetical protein